MFSDALLLAQVAIEDLPESTQFLETFVLLLLGFRVHVNYPCGFSCL
jgi:hypothetical protein